MATTKKTQNRWMFSSQQSQDFTILDGKGKTYGHLRVKPSAILWKPKNKSKYRRIGIEKFDEVMKTNSGVTEAKS